MTTCTFAGARSWSGETAGPVVTRPRTGSRPRPSTTRWSVPTWSWKVLLSATRTSGSSPGGGVHGSTQAGSARRGPDVVDVGVELGREVEGLRGQHQHLVGVLRLVPDRSELGQPAAPCAASFSLGRPVPSALVLIAFMARSWSRPSGPRAGRKPEPNGGMPGAGTE